jgi:hypothetical protein
MPDALGVQAHFIGVELDQWLAGYVGQGDTVAIQ